MPVLLRFVALALVWGSSFLLMMIGLEGLDPGQVVFARLGVGALTLLALSAVTRSPLPRSPRVLGHLLVVGLFLCTIPFTLFSWAELHVSSGTASILNATTPLMTALVSAAALAEERFTRPRVVGLLLGFVGVVVLVAPWASGGGPSVSGSLACLAATACYGIAFTYLRRFVTPLGLAPLTVATGQVGLGFLALVPVFPLWAGRAPGLSLRVVLAMLALGALCSGVAYVWNTEIVAAWGAARASAVTYLTPVVGVALGVALLGEPLTWSEPVGAAIVVLGIAVLQGRIRIRALEDGSTTR